MTLFYDQYSLRICIDGGVHLLATSPVNRGIALLLMLTLSLGIFFFGVVILNIARRKRRAGERAAVEAKRDAQVKHAADPWYEAGRRTSEDQQEDNDTPNK